MNVNPSVFCGGRNRDFRDSYNDDDDDDDDDDDNGNSYVAAEYLVSMRCL